MNEISRPLPDTLIGYLRTSEGADRLRAALGGKPQQERTRETPKDESLKAALAHADARLPPPPPPVRLISYSEFLKDFTPPDYLVFGLLQRRFLYALTAPSGAGKTAAALLLATIAGAVSGGTTFAGREVERGNVLYLCAENPDDVKMRLIGMRAKERESAGQVVRFEVAPFLWFEAIRRPLADMVEALAAQAPPHGFQLVIVDTSTAYFPGDDENSNVEAGDHARTLRRLTELPGGPTVIALCHPPKAAASPFDLVPRGGAAFNNEIDGNLTLWRPEGEDVVTLHHLKMRGAGFEAVEFKLEPVITTALKDSKGRLIPTVRLRPVDEVEAAEDSAQKRRWDDAVLLAHVDLGNPSRADVARRLGWIGQADGAPLKSRVDRCLKRLKGRKLVDIDKATGGAVTVTKAGHAEVAARIRPFERAAE